MSTFWRSELVLRSGPADFSWKLSKSSSFASALASASTSASAWTSASASAKDKWQRHMLP